MSAGARLVVDRIDEEEAPFGPEAIAVAPVELRASARDALARLRHDGTARCLACVLGEATLRLGEDLGELAPAWRALGSHPEAGGARVAVADRAARHLLGPLWAWWHRVARRWLSPHQEQLPP